MIWLEGGGEELVAAWCEAILNREDLALHMLVGQDLKDVEQGLDSFDNVPHVEGEDEKWIQIDVRDFMVFGDCQRLHASVKGTNRFLSVSGFPSYRRLILRLLPYGRRIVGNLEDED